MFLFSVIKVVDLKAVLAQEQQALKTGQRPTTASIRSGATARGRFEPNAGVEERRRRDEEAYAEDQAKPLDYVEKRLNEKAQLYDKFVRGEAQYDPNMLSSSDSTRSRRKFQEDRNDIAIDFEQKHLDYIDRQRGYGSNEPTDEFGRRRRSPPRDRERDRSHNDRDEGFYLGSGEFYHEDIAREEQRRKWEADMRRTADEEAEEARKRAEQRIVLNQLMADTREGREKHKELQMKRKLAKLSRSEAIKQRASSIKESEEASLATLEGAEAEEEPGDEETPEKSQRLRLKRPKLS